MTLALRRRRCAAPPARARFTCRAPMPSCDDSNTATATTPGPPQAAHCRARHACPRRNPCMCTHQQAIPVGICAPAGGRQIAYRGRPAHVGQIFRNIQEQTLRAHGEKCPFTPASTRNNRRSGIMAPMFRATFRPQPAPKTPARAARSGPAALQSGAAPHWCTVARIAPRWRPAKNHCAIFHPVSSRWTCKRSGKSSR